MNNKLNPRRKLFFAAAGGLAGYFVTVLAIFTVIVVALMSGAFVFGGGISSRSEKLLISVLVPTLISLGAGIPAWTLGAKFWRGLLAGIVAMGVFIFIESNGGQQVDYGLFNQRETLAYISAALVSVLIATVGRNELHPRKFVVLITFVVALGGLRFVVPEENFVVGIVASLLAWILLPLSAAFFAMPEQNRKNE